jgi:hypothetical protein
MLRTGSRELRRSVVTGNALPPFMSDFVRYEPVGRIRSFNIARGNLNHGSNLRMQVVRVAGRNPTNGLIGNCLLDYELRSNPTYRSTGLLDNGFPT